MNEMCVQNKRHARDLFIERLEPNGKAHTLGFYTRDRLGGNLTILMLEHYFLPYCRLLQSRLFWDSMFHLVYNTIQVPLDRK